MAEILDIDVCNSKRRDEFDDDFLYGETENSASGRFLTMDAECFDLPMSMQAKFLLCYVMRLTKTGWKMHLNDLCEKLCVNRKSIYKYLKELIDHGYCVRHQFKDEKNQFLKSKYRFFDLSRKAKSTLVEIPYPKKRNADENIKENNLNPRFPNFGIPKSGIPKNGTHINNNIVKDNIIKKQQQLNAKKSSLPENQEVAKNAAASYMNIFLQEQDLLIRDELTDVQLQCIEESLKRISELKRREEVKFALLSTKHFTAAENDFVKKLNTITKMIRSGKWKKPAGMINAKEKAKQKASDEKAQKIRILEAEKNHAKYMIESFQDNISDPRSKKFHECWSIRFAEVDQKIKNLTE